MDEQQVDIVGPEFAETLVDGRGNKAVDYDGIQWLWAFLWFIGGFFCMDLCYLKMALGSPLKAVPHFKAFIKERFGRS